MAGPECDNDMDHHHARVSCRGDQIGHTRNHIGGLLSRHEPGEGIDLIIHHQQCGAPGIDVRKLRHGFLLAGDAMLTAEPYKSSWAFLRSWLTSMRFQQGLA
jgi:hypothetical protein